MTTLTIRPDVGEARCYSLAVSEQAATATKLFVDIADLVKLNDASGQLDDDMLVSELQQFFNAPNVDRERNLRLWHNSRGELIAFGQLVLMSQQKQEIEAYLYFDIHPGWQGKALETEILQWGEERLGEVGRVQNLSLKLLTFCRNDRLDRLIRLEKQGFTHARSFLTMSCSLNQPISSPALPSGFTLRQFSSDGQCFQFPLGDVKDWVQLFNESFIDHWQHQDLTVETARHWLFNNPHCKPELNLVAVAPDGIFAAFCVGYINWDENALNRCNEGWIKVLGTRRGFRRMGLGRAMLLAQMQQFKAAGVEVVKLGVDAENLTSATRLYQSVGFQPIKTWLSYAKKIQL
ncbi:MAG TPA: GNAT family N-acetyltransferase [Waterburya sp.]|jgi:ribosomal protein S18 acetylase RimI-like enzyme